MGVLNWLFGEGLKSNLESTTEKSQMSKYLITFEDTAIIRDFEGERLAAYKCPAGVWTISYGLTGPDIKGGLVITKEQSKEMFMNRIQYFIDNIEPLLKEQLTNNQFLAILSFVWNIGIGAFTKSTLLKLINARKFNEASEQFIRWNKAGGKVLFGLTRRRIAEKHLFLS